MFTTLIDIRGQAMFVRISLVVAVLATVVTLTPSLHAADAKRPNVIVIVGDDMGYADIGVHGSKEIPTPNLDALAASGARFTDGYVSCPYCSPTRAGLLTGRFQTRFGHEFNPGGDAKKGGGKGKKGRKNRKKAFDANGEPNGLPLTETTVADRFKAAGYKTGWVGKWHLGNTPNMQPQARGFDETFGFLAGAHSYFDRNDNAIRRNGEPVAEPEYLTDAFGREAVAFIDRHATEPFFLYLAFNAVHTPVEVNDERQAMFSEIKDKRRRTYAAMMAAMDENIGKVIAALREKKLDKDTLVFFFSDNGGPVMNGVAQNGADNGPLRGSKRTTLEGGIRVPFFVSWPGHIPAGQVDNRPVISLDVVPTALAAAGIEAPADAKLDGVNLLPYLEGKDQSKPHETLYWRFGDQMAIRDGDWKLVRYDVAAEGKKPDVSEAKLYDLSKDLGEKNDLTSSDPDRAKALQAKWDEWNKLNVPPKWGPGPVAMKKQQPAPQKVPAGT